MKEDDDKDLGDAIPTKFPADLEEMLAAIVEHSGLDRSKVVRRCVRFAMDEVAKRDAADWLLYDEKKPLKLPSKKRPADKKEKRARLTDKDWVSLSVFGTVPAGWPDNRESTEPLRTIKVARGLYPDGAFGLDVRGDSMNKARGKFGPILDGETVVLLPPELREAKHGDIVAALIDEQSTLKRLDCKAQAECVLRAESDSPVWKGCMKPAHELVIQGVVVGKV